MKKSTLREYVEAIVVAVILALFVRTWVFQAFKIPTGSMEPNLLIGDHLLVNKFATGPTATALEGWLLPVTPVARGDILVFKYPDDPARDFIKRVVGLPGETLEVRDAVVYVDGRPLDEPYLRNARPHLGPARDNFGPVTVPREHYFMMGDHRNNSQDSRFWGPLPHAYLKGKAVVIYWSFDAPPGLLAQPEVGILRRVTTVLTNLVSGTRWERLLLRIR